MYLPKHFTEHSPEHFSEIEDRRVRELIEQNSFATVFSYMDGGEPSINHLPLVLSREEGEEKVLLGHMSKQNPQWIQFQKNPKCTMVIHGPHTYITPTWYTSGRDVPTWNYAVVHLHGRIELIESFEEQVKILKVLTAHFEDPSPKPWIFELPEDLASPRVLESSIISFKFHIQKYEAKFKLSQNRSAADQQGVIKGLSERSDEMSGLVMNLMLGNPSKK